MLLMNNIVYTLYIIVAEKKSEVKTKRIHTY